MPMHATTVRFSDDLWRLLEGEASHQGVSAAQFVRDATILRVAHLAGRRGDADARESIETIAEHSARRRHAPAVEPLASVRAPARLSALRRTGLLDRPASESFDRITRVTSSVLDVPVALVSLVDRDRQFFASCVGVSEPWISRRETPLSHSFCQHAVASREPLVISDAREHPVLRDNLAIRDLGVIAYAGAPVITDDGHALGTLCAIDHRPRHWTTGQVDILRDLAGTVESEIRLLSQSV
jgi:GAF domain-containing protein